MTTPLVTLIPVKPTGTKMTVAFVQRSDGSGGIEEVEVKIPPRVSLVAGQAFRRARVGLGLTMGEAARSLGLSVANLSGLELGEYKLSDDDRDGALKVMEQARQAKEGAHRGLST